MFIPRAIVLASLLALLAPAISAYGQEAKAKPKATNPAFAPITDDPKLPRVLLIGDSISIGYTLPVRTLLAGKANVHRPATNCGPSSRGVENIDQWLGTGKWDVIHFNFGIHDTVYYGEDGKRSKPGVGRHQVPIADYENNLKMMIAKMKATGAKVIFATTTPVPEGTSTSIAGDEVEYNRVASKLVQEAGGTVDDLYSFAKPRLSEIQRPRDVHFTTEGSQALAEQVVSSIQQALVGG
jgi:hypothetical protein